MAQRSQFFNSINKDRVYKAEDFAEYFASFVKNGIFPHQTENLSVTAGETDLSVTVGKGKAWINGYFFVNDSALKLTIPRPDGQHQRIDIVVLQWNKAKRSIELIIKSGTPSAQPQPPVLERTSDVYELWLTQIKTPAAATVVRAQDIVDIRNNTKPGEAEPYAGTVSMISTGSGGNVTVSDTETGVDTATTAASINLVRKKVEQTDYTVERLRKDANGVFQEIQYKRKDGKLAIKSVLSGGTSPKYTTRTITYYGIDGTSVEKTTITDLTYDADNDYTKEAIRP